MDQLQVVLTSKDSGDRLTKKEPLSFAPLRAGEKINIILQPEETFQEIVGFGGAFTEAAAYTLSRMSPEKRAQAVKSYYDRDEGLGYSIGRVHIHSCDFALENYTYVDEDDAGLESFSVARDEKWIIPLIKDAEAARGGSIRLLASPWSPPGWMKTNGEMNHGGKLLPEYFGVWADYYGKFIKAYRDRKLTMWGVSVQNEPAAVQTWDSCIYSGEEERDFVKHNLGPALEKAGLGDIKIIIWDHNRDIMVERASAVLSDPEAAKYVWGTGIHWYMNEDFENSSKVHELFPRKHLLFTEGCQEGGVHLGAWHTGERYGRNMIGDLNNWVEGYLDWNIVLDEKGGPNHVGNYCDAPIIADTVTDTLHYNSSYYYIGHFSKFIMPGAVRIGLKTEKTSVKATAFRNPSGEIVLVMMNDSDDEAQFSVGLGDRRAELQMPPHSIASCII